MRKKAEVMWEMGWNFKADDEDVRMTESRGEYRVIRLSIKCSNLNSKFALGASKDNEK